MTKIRILHVVTNMNSGGLETMLMNYFRNIDREQFQFDFLIQRNEKSFYEDEIKQLGGIIHRIKPLSYLKYFQFRKSLRQFFYLHNYYDIVHVHTNAFAYFPLKEAKIAGIKIRICHSHIALMNERSFKLIIQNILKKRIIKYANYFLACGSDAGRWLYGKKQEFTIMNNAIYLKEFSYNSLIRDNLRNEFGITNSLCITSIARFCNQKNHIFLIKIFSEIVKIQPNTKLFLVGEGELQSNIEKMVLKLNLNSKVIFLGVRSDVNTILQAMDIFVLPSFYEGLPLSLIEAQASGIKCFVSTSVSDEVSILEDLMMFISLDKSPKYWAEKIIENSNYKRRDTTLFLTNAGYNIFDNINWLEKKYFSLVNTK